MKMNKVKNILQLSLLLFCSIAYPASKDSVPHNDTFEYKLEVFQKNPTFDTALEAFDALPISSKKEKKYEDLDKYLNFFSIITKTLNPEINYDTPYSTSKSKSSQRIRAEYVKNMERKKDCTIISPLKTMKSAAPICA